MITELTSAQERRLIEFREEWRQIGLQNGPVNVQAVTPIFAEMYRAIGKKPVPVIRLPSPASAMLALSALSVIMAKPKGMVLGDQLWDQLGSQLSDQLGGKLWDQLRSQLWDQLRSQLWDQLRDQLRDQLWDQLGSQLSDQLRDQLRDQLWDQLRDQVWSELLDQLGDQVWSELWGQLGSQLGGQLRGKLRECFWGNCEVHWISFYAFASEIGCRYRDLDSSRLRLWDGAVRHCGWWWPYEHIIVAADRPTETRWNSEYLLHNSAGPAVLFADGYALYALNGVRVPEWLATTPAEQLDPRKIVKLRNVEQRREGVRKVGVERLVQQMGAKVLDRQGDYELITLNLGDERIRPYLKMRNPSLGVYHVEGIHPNCKTVKEALAWRNGSEVTPDVLT